MRFLSVVLMFLLMLLPVAGAPKDDKITDDHLVDRVRIQIANDREIGGNPIDVTVTGGVVELTGKVRTDKQKTRAEKVAKKVKGVKSVVNKISVSPV